MGIEISLLHVGQHISFIHHHLEQSRTGSYYRSETHDHDAVIDRIDDDGKKWARIHIVLNNGSTEWLEEDFYPRGRIKLVYDQPQPAKPGWVYEAPVAPAKPILFNVISKDGSFKSYPIPMDAAKDLCQAIAGSRIVRAH